MRRDLHLRGLADQALSRTAGAPLIAGNHVRVLRDARENYPAWEAAIRDATSSIHLEMYIIHLDRVGRRFIDLLAAKARSGVAVRVVYDWFGCGFAPVLGLFRPLELAGGEVRVFNPPSIKAMFGWVRRNHRKVLVVDGEVAFIGGLCIGEAWEGFPNKGLAPWRDTAVEIRGPAVSSVEEAFAESWQWTGGAPLPAVASRGGAGHGTVSLRVVPTEPFLASMFRVDLFVAAVARQRLWITDAYFMGHGPFASALRRAARDGVDVRLLLPHGSDVGWTVPVSRTLYRSLLESGVKVYEWTGSMLHSKTAVADSRWARVGSTNLNVNSWLGNWELDVAIEDAEVAATMEAQFLDDIAQSIAITITADGRLMAAPPQRRRGRARRSARRVAREVTGVARSLGAAVTGSRPLEDFEAGPLLVLGATFCTLAAVFLYEPRVVAWPLVGLAAWAGVTLLIDGWRARIRRRAE
jgi:cardiolipin synthase